MIPEINNSFPETVPETINVTTSTSENAENKKPVKNLITKPMFRIGMLAFILVTIISGLAISKNIKVSEFLTRTLRLKPVLRQIGLLETSTAGFFEALETQDLTYDFDNNGYVDHNDYSVMAQSKTTKVSEEPTTVTATAEETSDSSEKINLPSVTGFSSDLFTGAATISYPISLSSGPTGLSPSLAISYSSASIDDMWVGTKTSYRTAIEHGYQKQAGEIGLGWNLGAAGSITRDEGENTSAEYPTEMDDDVFHISFGGGSAKLIPKDGSETYSQSVEEYITSPDLNIQVIRYGQLIADDPYTDQTEYVYRWEVKDRIGTTYWFGSESMTYDATRPWKRTKKGDYQVRLENKWNQVKTRDVYGQEVVYTWLKEEGKHYVWDNANAGSHEYCCINGSDPCTSCSGTCKLEDGGEGRCSDRCCVGIPYVKATYLDKIQWGSLISGNYQHEVDFVRDWDFCRTGESFNGSNCGPADHFKRYDRFTHLEDDEGGQKYNAYFNRLREIKIKTWSTTTNSYQIVGDYLLKYAYIFDRAVHPRIPSQINSNTIYDESMGTDIEDGYAESGKPIHLVLKQIIQKSADLNRDGTPDEQLPTYKFDYTRLSSFRSAGSSNEQASSYNDIFLSSADNGYKGSVVFTYSPGALDMIMCNDANNYRYPTASCSCNVNNDTGVVGCNAPVIHHHAYNYLRHRLQSKVIYDGTGKAIRDEYLYQNDDGKVFDQALAYFSSDDRLPNEDTEIRGSEFEFLGYPQVTVKTYDAASGGVLKAMTRQYFYQNLFSQPTSKDCFKPHPLRGQPSITQAFDAMRISSPYTTSYNKSAINILDWNSGYTNKPAEPVTDENYGSYDFCKSFLFSKTEYFVEARGSRSQIHTSTPVCTATLIDSYSSDGWHNPQRASNLGEIACSSITNPNPTNINPNDDRHNITLYTTEKGGGTHIGPKPKETWVSNNPGLTPNNLTSYNYTKTYYGYTHGTISDPYARVTKNEILKDSGVDDSFIVYATSSVQYGDQHTDENGNNNPWLVTKTINSLGNETHTAYDTIYRMYPKTVINAKGHKTTTSYDFENSVPGHPNNGFPLGLPIKMVDANNQTTLSTYDAFGRIKDTYLPGRNLNNNPNQQEGYFYFNSNDAAAGGFPCDWGHHCIANLGGGEQPKFMTQSLTLMNDSGTLGNRSITRTFYNGLGQSVQTQQSWLNGIITDTGIPVAGEGNKDIFVSSAYGALGEVLQVSHNYTITPYQYLVGGVENSASPYIAPAWSSLVKTINSYDGLGRLRYVNYPDLTIEETIYDLEGNPLKTKAIDKNCRAGLPCTEKITTNDIFGQTIQIQEVEKNVSEPKTYTTKYSYHPVLGLLKSTTDTNNVVVNDIVYDNIGRKIAMTDIDMGFWQYDYNSQGLLTHQDDPNNREKDQYIKLSYDELNRLTKKELVRSNGTKTSLLEYGYDSTANGSYGIGRKTSTTTPGTESVFYVYNSRGQITKTIQDITGFVNDLTFETTYDEGGRVTSNKYPAFDEMVAETVSTVYAGPYAISMTGTKPYVKAGSVSYNKNGQVVGLSYGNSINQSYSYDATNLRLQEAKITNNAGSTIFGVNYKYDKVGNIDEMTDLVRNKLDPLSLTQKFVYDPLYRLTYANNLYGVPEWGFPTAVNYKGQFEYDNVGNITKKADSIVRGGIIENRSVNLSYSSKNYHRPETVSIMGADTTYSTYTYDSNGNLTYDGLRNYLYDDEGRLTSVTIGTTPEPSIPYDPNVTPTPTPTRAPTPTKFNVTPTPTTPPSPDPTSTTGSCSVSLLPATYSLAPGKSVFIAASVTTTGGAAVKSVSFSSTDTSLLTVSPIADYGSPYQTRATATTSGAKGTVRVRATVSLKDTTTTCTGVSTVYVNTTAPTETTIPTPTKTATPVPTKTATPTPTPPTTGSCSVSLLPATYTLRSGQSVYMTASVTTSDGASVKRVTFSSNNTYLAKVLPSIDYYKPYTTTVTAGTTTSTSTAVIKAIVYLNGTTSTCSARSTVVVNKNHLHKHSR